MARGKPKEEITVVAELTVSWSGGQEIVRSFDAAWRRALELPVPVHVKFNDFVRKD